jgi:hypothetical protein
MPRPGGDRYEKPVHVPKGTRVDLEYTVTGDMSALHRIPDLGGRGQ